MDLTRAWGLSVPGRPLYREDVKDTLQQMRGIGYIRKSSSGLTSQFNKEFIKLLEKKTDTQLQGFSELLQQDWVRENVFSLDNIKKFYQFNPAIAKLSIQRTRVMFIEPFQIFILAKIMQENNLSKNMDDEILPGLLQKNIFYGTLDHNIILDAALEQLEEHSEDEVVRNANVKFKQS